MHIQRSPSHHGKSLKTSSQIQTWVPFHLVKLVIRINWFKSALFLQVITTWNSIDPSRIMIMIWHQFWKHTNIQTITIVRIMNNILVWLCLSLAQHLSPVPFHGLSTASDVVTYILTRKWLQRMYFPIIIFIPTTWLICWPSWQCDRTPMSLWCHQWNGIEIQIEAFSWHLFCFLNISWLFHPTWKREHSLNFQEIYRDIVRN